MIDKAGLWHDLTIRSRAQRCAPVEVQPDELRILCSAILSNQRSSHSIGWLASKHIDFNLA